MKLLTVNLRLLIGFLHESLRASRTTTSQTLGVSRQVQHHKGFTLIELLVVIAIIASLVALLIPAVMSARESARRSQCQNHLRQLGIALHNHHSAHGEFPPGTQNEWSWIAQVLPYLEETNIHQRFNFDFELFEPSNHHLTETTIPVLVCPSDAKGDYVHQPGNMPGLRFAHTNYLGSLDARGGANRGMFGEYTKTRLAQVVDGASKTIFVGERGVVIEDEYSHGWWVWGPDTLVSAAEGFRQGYSADHESVDHWWSHHAGGGQFVFVDGSVHFISYSISPSTFVSLGTKDGGEFVSRF